MAGAIYQIPTGLVRLIRFFSWQPQVEADFSRGIVRDLPRSSIPVGGLYDSVDFLVDRPALLRKRGGTSNVVGTVGGNTGGVNFVGVAEYQNGVLKIAALGADGHLWEITPGAYGDRGAFPITTIDKPKFYIDKMIVTDGQGLQPPQKVYIPNPLNAILGSTQLGGAPPPAKLSAIHLSHIVLGASALNPARIWFSPIPDPESAWDLNNAYLDTNHILTALTPIQGVLLCFSHGATERLIGSVPPGTTGENMSLQPLGQIGCADARSVAPWGSFVVFASQQGVHVTNGSTFDSLTEKADGSGILSYWRQQYATVAANNGFISAGIVNKNYYVVTLGYGSTIVDTLVCYLPMKAWTRTSNIGCMMYAPSDSGSDELYGATMSGHDGNHVIQLSGILSPSAANKNDANGVPVQPTVQFRMSGTGIGIKAYGDGYLTYDMRDAATDNPTLAVNIDTGIEATSGFLPVPGSPLAETTDSVRKRFFVSKDAQAVNAQLVQTGPSSKTEVYLFEVEQRQYDLQAVS